MEILKLKTEMITNTLFHASCNHQKVVAAVVVLFLYVNSHFLCFLFQFL